MDRCINALSNKMGIILCNNRNIYTFVSAPGSRHRGPKAVGIFWAMVLSFVIMR